MPKQIIAIKCIVIVIAASLFLGGAFVPVLAENHAELGEVKTITAPGKRRGAYPKTIVDSSGKTLNFYKPVKRVIPLGVNDLEVLRTLRATDLVVGVSVHVRDDPFYYPGYQRYPSIGERFTINLEMVLMCRPDLIICSTRVKPSELDDKLTGADIAVARFEFNNLETYESEIKTLAYLLDKEDDGDEYLKFYHAKMDKIRSLIDRIPESERPTVYLEGDYGGGRNYMTCGAGHLHHQLLLAAGGENIFSDINFYSEISAEAVMSRNPQVIIKYKYPAGHINRNRDNTKDLEAVREEILSRSELINVDAIKNGRVYVFDWYSSRGGAMYFLCLAQMAKWLHPQSLKDLRPREDYEEYLRKFQKLDIDLDTYGVFFYPE